MRYSILIADDEAHIRKGFIARLRHLGYEPQEIYEAGKAGDALLMIERHHPEIVVTDIRMPAAAEGLEFIRRARSLAPHSEFIILSGYTEFAYAEQAISLGVYAYMVKPLSNEALARVMDELLDRLREKNRLQQLVARDEESNWHVGKQLVGLLAGSPPAEEEHAGAQSGFVRPNSQYLLALLHIDPASYAEKAVSLSDVNSAREEVLACCTELDTADRAIAIDDPSDRNQVFLFMRGGSAQAVTRFADEQLRALRMALRRRGDITLTMGVSGPAAKITPHMLRQAQEALYLRILHGNGLTYRFADVANLREEGFSEEQLGMLQRLMERRDLRGVEALLREMFGTAQKAPVRPSHLRILWVRVANMLLEILGRDAGSIAERAMLDFNDLKRFDSIEKMCMELVDIVETAFSAGQMGELDSTCKIHMAEQYIDKCYSQDISVNTLAEMFDLSPNYFSTLFRRETGKNVVGYIRNVRLEKACAMLRDTGESVVGIAARVGYTDSQYFFRLFKKELGLSPLQYRKRSRAAGLQL